MHTVLLLDQSVHPNRKEQVWNNIGYPYMKFKSRAVFPLFFRSFQFVLCEKETFWNDELFSSVFLSFSLFATQCDGSRGVCPDERVGGQNGVTLLGGRRRDGVTTVVFQRSQMAQNDGLDKEIPAIGRVNVIAAIGPLNSRNEANYHSIRTGPQGETQ